MSHTQGGTLNAFFFLSGILIAVLFVLFIFCLWVFVYVGQREDANKKYSHIDKRFFNEDGTEMKNG